MPVLSLGAPRRFLIRPEAGGASTVFTPAGPRGSLNFNSRPQA